MSIRVHILELVPGFQGNSLPQIVQSLHVLIGRLASEIAYPNMAGCKVDGDQPMRVVPKSGSDSRIERIQTDSFARIVFETVPGVAATVMCPAESIPVVAKAYGTVSYYAMIHGTKSSASCNCNNGFERLWGHRAKDVMHMMARLRPF